MSFNFKLFTYLYQQSVRKFTVTAYPKFLMSPLPPPPQKYYQHIWCRFLCCFSQKLHCIEEMYKGKG